MAIRANEPLILSLSMRMLWEMKRNVGTSLMIRSYRALSRVMACWALSLTLPLDHFFFFAAFPPLEDVGAALALAYRGHRDRSLVNCFIRHGRDPSSIILPVEARNSATALSPAPSKGRPSCQRGAHHCLAGPVVLVVVLSPLPVYLR